MRRTGLVIGAFAVAAVAAASTPLWTGQIVADGFTQPAVPPPYVRQAAATLDTTHPGTRVYALPGNDFAAYRWGDTIDTVYPGLMTRPFVTHEQQIMGSLPTADLLQAVDSPLQDGTMDWNTLAPMASLMSAGDVLVQYDQAYERYDTPDPQQVAVELATTPPGLSRPGVLRRPACPTCPCSPTSTRPPWPARRTRDGPRRSSRTPSPIPDPIVRTESTTDPAGRRRRRQRAGHRRLGRAAQRQPDHPLRRDPGHPPGPPRRTTLGKPADLVVTDTNRKQGYRWNSLNENTGYTETAAQGPDTADPSDAPLNLFPGAPADAQTTDRVHTGSPR